MNQRVKLLDGSNAFLNMILRWFIALVLSIPTLMPCPVCLALSRNNWSPPPPPPPQKKNSPPGPNISEKMVRGDQYFLKKFGPSLKNLVPPFFFPAEIKGTTRYILVAKSVPPLPKVYQVVRKGRWLFRMITMTSICCMQV